MRIGSLFSGYGGLEMGTQAAMGGDVAWHAEIDPGACKILAHRYPGVPNLGDISTVDWSQVEPVDVLTGGFPCQDVSAAGKRLGIRPGTRSGLWTQFAYAIDQLRPSLVVIENVRGLLSAPAHSELEPCPWCVGDDGGVPLRALGAVLGDLADLGYDASWQGLRASDVGAPHGRFRVFIIAWPATDARRLRGEQGRGSGPGETEGGWTHGQLAGRGPDVATDTEGHGRDEGRPESARLIGGSDDALSGYADASHADREGLEGWQLHAERRDQRSARANRVEPAADADSRRLSRVQAVDSAQPAIGRGHADRLGVEAGRLEWGPYGDAVRRWERILGRPAPAPTEPGHNGQPRLAPAFVEFMMGLPAGWVTDVPGLSRAEQLKALGNGVVPQQAAEALRLLLPDVEGVAA